MYSCTCQDFEKTFIICKHIHYILCNSVMNNVGKCDKFNNVNDKSVNITPLLQSNKCADDEICKIKQYD